LNPRQRGHYQELMAGAFRGQLAGGGVFADFSAQSEGRRAVDQQHGAKGQIRFLGTAARTGEAPKLRPKTVCGVNSRSGAVGEEGRHEGAEKGAPSPLAELTIAPDRASE